VDNGEDPASAVFSAAVKRTVAAHNQFRGEFNAIETKYTQILQKYMPAIQRSQDPSIFDAIEEEIVFVE